MRLAVELLFDSESEHTLRGLWKALSEELGQPNALEGRSTTPHISLSAFEATELGKLWEALREACRGRKAWDVQLNSVGTFPGDEGVLFLAPAPSLELLKMHEDFHAGLIRMGARVRPYYYPGQLAFHCTLDIGLPSEKLAAAMLGLKKHLPLKATVQSVALMAIHDDHDEILENYQLI
jgi:hypothetical protein